MSTLLTLLGIAVGAILTYIFTRSHEQEKHYRLLKTGAYADYLRCVAEAAHLSLRSDEADLFARAADAKRVFACMALRKLLPCLPSLKKKVALLETHSSAQHSFVLCNPCGEI
jgi:hypothetical protein